MEKFYFIALSNWRWWVVLPVYSLVIPLLLIKCIAAIFLFVGDALNKTDEILDSFMGKNLKLSEVVHWAMKERFKQWRKIKQTESNGQ
jgi:hypothetical protein